MMRVRCYMRRARRTAGLSLDQVMAATGLAKGELSMFERGHSVPRDDQIRRLTPIYGPPEQWYPPGVLRLLMPDLGDCAGCDDELDPDASRRRRYHNEHCRAYARRRRSSP